MSNDHKLGFWACLGCYTIWGCLPLYFKYMHHIAPFEMLAHRIIWSLPTGLLLVTFAAGGLKAIRESLTKRRLMYLAMSSLLIACNWLVYIWAVSENRIMEASLGYYINPLLNVVIGAAFFSEKLRILQWVSVALAAIGVGVMTIAFGQFPWLACFLCLTFSGYSVIRKQVQVDSRAGFVVEAALLFPLALLWLIQFANTPGGRWVGDGTLADTLGLIAAGPITAVPLILFALGAKRLRLSTVGMMQFIGPTLQFALAVFVFGEVFETTHALAFGFIWVALILFSKDSFRAESERRANLAAPA